MIHEFRPATPEEAVEHFGAKGMHWGVRKSEISSPSNGPAKPPMTTEHKKAIAKKVAIGTGVLLVAAGTAYVVYSMKKNGKLPIKGLSSSTSGKGKIATKAIVEEPTSLIHFSRGKNVGLRFLKQGGIPLTVLSEYDRSGLNEGGSMSGYGSVDTIQKYGIAGAEKIAAKLTDPSGRKDFSGRPIVHDIIIPKIMSAGINTIDDVKEKIWPLLKPDYDALYSAVPKGFQ